MIIRNVQNTFDKNIRQIVGFWKYEAIATSFTSHRVQVIVVFELHWIRTNYIQPNNYDVDSNTMKHILS